MTDSSEPSVSAPEDKREASVDIHKPKSWHGPGEFFREYLIIVVGVLTALGGEQAIEWIHRQGELAETREALRAEIAQNGALVALGAALDRCRLAMFDKDDDWARGGPEPERLPATGVPVLNFSVWEVAKAGSLSRMPVKERLSYSLVYDHFGILQRGIELQTEYGLSLSQYTNQPQLDLDHDQARRVLELTSAYRAIIATRNNRLLPTLSSDFQTLGVSPEPVSESGRERLADLCKAAGLPAPTL
jgi:hypothetical protein